MNNQARFKVKLGVLGSPSQWKGPDGDTWAYEPYVREMQIWADLFAEVEVCGHTGEGPMVGNLAPYGKENIVVKWIPYTQDEGFSGARRRLFRLPGLIWECRKTILESDFVFLRSPSHFGLVGAVLVRLMKRGSITKWAGENAAYAGERIPSRLNRIIEALPSRRHFTLVYGEPRRPHHISFLPALMTVEELALGRRISGNRVWEPPWKILCVGRLSRPKNFELAIRGLGELKHRSPEIPWTFTMVGEGVERQNLQDLVTQYDIADRVTFTGALSFTEVQSYYGAAHVVIMPGVKEGWPKIIAESWAHGAIPVAARAGLVPWILKEESSGVVFDPAPEALAAALSRLLSDPSRLPAMSQQMYSYAGEISLEQFKRHLEAVLIERCGLQ